MGVEAEEEVRGKRGQMNSALVQLFWQILCYTSLISRMVSEMAQESEASQANGSGLQE
jgi:hypothetical protein